MSHPMQPNSQVNNQYISRKIVGNSYEFADQHKGR